MTLNHILHNYLTATILAVVTIAVSGCNTLTSDSQDLITRSPKNSQLLNTLSTQSDACYSVAYSPNISHTLASADSKTVKVWNPNKGRILHSLSGQAWAVSFSPDGQILASGSQDGSLNLWDIKSGKLIRTLKHSEPVIDVVFSPDGKYIASGLDLGSNIRLWNWRTGEIIRLKDDPDAYKMGFSHIKYQPTSFSSDSQTLFATNASQSGIQSWNLQTGKRTGNFEAKSSINAVAISPDGNNLAVGIRDNAIKLWNVSNGQLIYNLIGHTGEVKTVAFSPDGKQIASGSQDGSVKLWNISTGKVISTFRAHKQLVWAVAFNPDGKTIASCGQDGTIKIWRTPI
ncbi:WD40 repeat domain-containing protein [Anabaena azotica]|uniref:WD40 repeat domain-containing protein n=1 Tax=Anabaena azotica FACHB-119 TaxID=947527 RepID=A0ABR8DBJ7_9NOST|nr:WD40 repeat domain-containing protein [Anabaena azotica]MBD2504474.1 WD40 repeat domain-containing protein [Anabaena azotica FACHB-119]